MKFTKKEQKMRKIFIVKHMKTGEMLPAYAENKKGFLYKIPFRETGLGIAISEQYTLKKPHWKRISNE